MFLFLENTLLKYKWTMFSDLLTRFCFRQTFTNWITLELSLLCHSIFPMAGNIFPEYLLRDIYLSLCFQGFFLCTCLDDFLTFVHLTFCFYTMNLNLIRFCWMKLKMWIIGIVYSYIVIIFNRIVRMMKLLMKRCWNWDESLVEP